MMRSFDVNVLKAIVICLQETTSRNIQLKMHTFRSSLYVVTRHLCMKENFIYLCLSLRYETLSKEDCVFRFCVLHSM